MDNPLITINYGGRITRGIPINMQIEDTTRYETILGSQHVIPEPRQFTLHADFATLEEMPYIDKFGREECTPITPDNLYKHNSQWLWDFIDS